MGALAKTYSFTAGTAIVAAQVNENFDDVVDWATNTPTLSATSKTTTIAGALAVNQTSTFTGLATFSGQIKIDHTQGANAAIYWEGATDDGYETYLRAIDPTAQRLIYLPNNSGTVALLTDITDPTWNDANNVLTTSVFN